MGKPLPAQAGQCGGARVLMPGQQIPQTCRLFLGSLAETASEEMVNRVAIWTEVRPATG